LGRPRVATPALVWWESVLHALWLFLPAYLANMAPVFVAKLLPGWNAPIDGGRKAADGRPLLGAGKTWRGLAGGTLLAGLVALGLVLWSRSWDLMAYWDYGASGYYAGQPVGEPPMCGPYPAAQTDLAPRLSCMEPARASALEVFLFGSAMGFSALVGDAVKSYFKRRLGKEGGASWIPFDQLDFVAFGLLGMLAFSWLLPEGWVWAALTDDWVVLATLLVLTPLLHLAVNRIGYWLKLKQVPW
jgi:CDP-2,3-bis-(O-geranylgeranyl)-sn-glycerol synthase